MVVTDGLRMIGDSSAHPIGHDKEKPTMHHFQYLRHTQSSDFEQVIMVIAVSKLCCGNAASMPHLRHTGTVGHDVWIMLIKATWFVKNLIPS